MSVLTQIPITETDEQKLAKIANTLKSISTRTYNELVRVQRDGINLVWRNREFTPQQIIDSFGSDAVKIFQFHSGLTEYLITVSNLDGIAYTPALHTNAFTIEDGKITVLDTPYVP